MHSFYISSITEKDTHILLSEEESKHACRVLRLKIGSEIQILDGNGGVYSGIISNDNPKKCEVRLVNSFFEEKTVGDIHIAVAPTKNMDRIEWFVEKATEIGITEISFVICENSERKILKLDRIEKIVVSAMKQSKRTFIPKLNPLRTFKEFVDIYPKAALAHCVDTNKLALKDCIKQENYPILIGPEGDFSLKEIELAKSKGYDFVSFGKNRLRTETAALYACMIAKTIFE